MSLSKIPFVIERTENKYKENYSFEVHSLKEDKRFSEEELNTLYAYFNKQDVRPITDSLSGTIRLYNLKSLLDFSYGEFHAE